MRIIILTSDATSWALRAWFHLTNKYWPEHPPVLVAGYTKPDFLKDDEFLSLGNFDDYPVNRWSDGLIKLLEQVSDETFIWTMDDFWPIRDIDHKAVVTLFDHITKHRELARIDLTADRAGAANSRITGYIDNLEIVATDLPSQYHLSLQAGIWRTSALKLYTVPGETGWEMELNGTTRMCLAAANVIGTTNEPLRYVIAIQKGKLALDGGYQGPNHALPYEDYIELLDLKYL